jgi:hypothetical protein
MLVKEVHPTNILPQVKVRFDGNLTLLKLEQPLNTYPVSPFVPILVTESGIVTLVKPKQFWKVLLPMLVTNPRIVTLVKLEQRLKALEPMVVTDAGRVTLNKPFASVNAPGLMLVTLYVTPLTTKDSKHTILPEALVDIIKATPEPTTYW